jgi:hypothetical protein
MIEPRSREVAHSVTQWLYRYTAAPLASPTTPVNLCSPQPAPRAHYLDFLDTFRLLPREVEQAGVYPPTRASTLGT